MEAGSKGIGLYIHIPFCWAKCTYCDFNSFTGLEELFDDYAAALLREMELVEPAPIRTIYVGGGTPTVLPPVQLAKVLAGIRDTFVLNQDAEITIEANPGTLDTDKLGKLSALGVNRLSLGVQSFEPGELAQLGRIHSAAEAVTAFQAARQAGFDNINLDLIYGLPGQPLGSWRDSLQRALELEPDHLSLYALTVEESTPLVAAIRRYEIPAPDPDLAADMYELAQGFLSAVGYLHYEISNWARTPAHVCQHNLSYWHNEAYQGIGAGAHSWRRARRWSNTAQPQEYMAQVLAGQQPLAAEEFVSPELAMAETMIMGLRLVDEGASFERIKQQFGFDPKKVYANEIAELVELGLLEPHGGPHDGRVRLSERGRLLGNQVFLHFLPD